MKYLFLILILALTSCAPIGHTNARPDAQPDIVEPGAPDAGGDAPADSWPCTVHYSVERSNEAGDIIGRTDMVYADISSAPHDIDLWACYAEPWVPYSCTENDSLCSIVGGDPVRLACIRPNVWISGDGVRLVQCGTDYYKDMDEDGEIELQPGYRIDYVTTNPRS